MQTATLTAKAAVSGNRSFKVTRGDQSPPVAKISLRQQILRHALPTTGNREIDAYRLGNLPNVLRGLSRVAIARAVKAPTMIGVVSGTVYRGCTYDELGSIISYKERAHLGVISSRVVTDTGVAFFVDAWQNIVELEIMKYHAFGTGTTNEAASQTALVTELTTEYATDNTRPTGSLTEGASGNIFRSVGTLSPDASVAITEHMLMSQAATGGGVGFDRSKFSAINLVSGDSLQITYDATFSSGG